jgi:monofunctional biosynthetic peptidoglycan transglycosylase
MAVIRKAGKTGKSRGATRYRPSGWRGVLLLFLFLFLAYQLWIFGHVLLYWAGYNPRSTAFMDAHLAHMQQKNPDARLQYQWAPYDRISPQLKFAVIAAEDAKFVDHHGFDWDGIQTAMEKNVKKGHVVAGGSTISQQLAKNLFLSGSRSPLRKAQEALITVELELVLSKRRILELYLNVVEWGDGVYGAEAAAHHYFGSSCTYLAAWQAAHLAAMLPNPRYYDKHRYTGWLMAKSGIIQARMHQVRIPR